MHSDATPRDTLSKALPTKFQILRAGSDRPEDHEVELDREPGYRKLKALIEPLLDGEHFEHVAVRHNGGARDMFVGEFSALDGSPRNEAATAIYRNNTLTREPGTDPESIPAIYGTAILFPDRRVWF